MNAPKKSLGQHWLHDTSSLETMCDMACVEQGDRIIEIGPGLGTLTEKLLERGAIVHAVEFDETLANTLETNIQKSISQHETPISKEVAWKQRLTVSSQDILHFNFTDLEPDYKVVANIPYYLTSNLVRVLSETTNRPLSVTLLIQKEVAVRLCAGPGNMSLLSVWAQMYFTCSLGPVVPARLFTPPPKIDSQIVHLQRKDTPLFGDIDKKLLARVVKAGFSNKRKTLLNSLSAGLQLDKEATATLLHKADINPKSRPQELPLENWLSLAKIY